MNDELRQALNKRISLQRVSQGSVEVMSPTKSFGKSSTMDPDNPPSDPETTKKPHFRSGWSGVPALPRSYAIPPSSARKQGSCESCDTPTRKNKLKSSNPLGNLAKRVDFSALDGCFTEWFKSVSDNSKKCPKSSAILQASSKAMRDLWLRVSHGHDGFDMFSVNNASEDELEEKLAAFIASMDDAEARNHIIYTTNEYLLRILHWIDAWLVRRASSSANHNSSLSRTSVVNEKSLDKDFIVFMEWLSRRLNFINKALLVENSAHLITTPELSSSPSTSDCESPVLRHSHNEIRQTIKAVMGRVSSEFEITLIDELQQLMQTDNIWDHPVVDPTESRTTSSSYPISWYDGKQQHGPQLVNLEFAVNSLLSRKAAHFMTSWSPTMVNGIGVRIERILEYSVDPQFSHCQDVMLNKLCNSIIVSINGSLRVFTRRYMHLTSHMKMGKAKTLLTKMKHKAITAANKRKASKAQNKENVTVSSPTSASQAQSVKLITTISPPKVTIEHLTAFINECDLMRDYCKLLSDDDNSKFTAVLRTFSKCNYDIFVECMQEISENFNAISYEISELRSKLETKLSKSKKSKNSSGNNS